MSKQTQANCLHHPDRPAIGHCFQCHTPLCEECRDHSIPDGIFCGRACYDKYLAYRSRRQPVVRSSRVKSFVVGLLVVAVAAAAAIYIGGKILRLPLLKSIYKAIAG